MLALEGTLRSSLIDLAPNLCNGEFLPVVLTSEARRNSGDVITDEVSDCAGDPLFLVL